MKDNEKLFKTPLSTIQNTTKVCEQDQNATKRDVLKTKKIQKLEMQNLMKKTELESRQDKNKIKKGLVHAIKHLNRSFRKQELRKKGITNERIQEISTTVFRLKGPTEYADQYINTRTPRYIIRNVKTLELKRKRFYNLPEESS